MTADIGTDISAWSITAATNQPDYTDSVGPNNLADNLRAIQAAVRTMYSADTIASAATIDLSAKTAQFVSVTGITTITGLGTVSAGVVKTLIFAGALTFTHNATSLILPTAASITTAVDDVAVMLSLGSGNWRCVGYMRKSGSPLLSIGTFGDGTVSAPGMGFTADTDTGMYRIGANNFGFSAAGAKVVDIGTAGVAVTGSLSATTSVTATTTHESGVSGYRMASGAHSFSYVTGNTSFVGSGASGLLFNTSSVDSMLINSGSAYFSGTVQSKYGMTAGSASETSATGIASLGTNAGFVADSYNSVSGSVLFKGRMLSFAGDTSRNALELENSGGMLFRVRSDGAVFADGAYSGLGADFAEYFETNDHGLRPGDSVCMDYGIVRMAMLGDDPIGVISATPAVIGNSAQSDGALVGLVGQIWVTHGQRIGSRWVLMKHGDGHDLYLVR